MAEASISAAGTHFPAIIRAAELGAATTLTRNGRAAAMIVPLDFARELYPELGDGVVPSRKDEGEPSSTDHR